MPHTGSPCRRVAPSPAAHHLEQLDFVGEPLQPPRPEGAGTRRPRPASLPDHGGRPTTFARRRSGRRTRPTIVTSRPRRLGWSGA